MTILEEAQGFLDALARRDLESASRYVDHDLIAIGLALRPLRGAQAWRESVAAFWYAFPDLETERLTLTAHGDEVTLVERVRGTHTGELHTAGLAPVPSTRHRIDVGPNTVVFRFAEGRVVRIHARIRRLQFAWQLGLWPLAWAVLRAPFLREKR
ncbi:MAG: ester cyclase [Chloroflexi bacterium]|nr:ester cyclase [Chloroflexota bacterium]